LTSIRWNYKLFVSPGLDRPLCIFRNGKS